MNKKRLYKQSGFLHPRGISLEPKLREKLQAIFDEYDQYHPQDLQLMVIHAAHMAATGALLNSKRRPSSKTVKSI